jgi:hypothetical protein
MEDVYKEETGKNESLICRAKEVIIGAVTTDSRTTCKLGDKITLTLAATITVQSSRHDFGWYIAVDGGNALTGKCALNSLNQNKTYNVTAPGELSWERDVIAANDTCGDIYSPTNGTIAMPNTEIANSLEITCADVDNDGYLDFSICFTSRDDEHDDVCKADAMYPSSVNKCDCSTINVMNVTVPKNETHSTCI